MESTINSNISSFKKNEYEPKNNTIILKSKLEISPKESLEQIKVNDLKENHANSFQLNVLEEISSKKFFVKLHGHNPRFFNITNIKKKINEIIEDYLKEKNINICDKIKGSFTYRGKRINLDDTIENIDHLSWITSNYTN